MDPSIDVARFTKNLATFMKESMEKQGLERLVLQLDTALSRALEISPGSTTATIAGLDNDHLVGINIGDSSVTVFRGSELAFQTRVGQWRFNCPFQIGSETPLFVEEIEYVEGQFT